MKTPLKLLPLLLLLALPAAVQAQYTDTTNNGTITITGYTGSGGAVTIPDTINGLPGWQTIWRGWQRLIWMSEGIETLIHT